MPAGLGGSACGGGGQGSALGVGVLHDNNDDIYSGVHKAVLTSSRSRSAFILTTQPPRPVIKTNIA